MQEVPFYPSPAERKAQRQEIIAELARKYSISLPADTPIEDVGTFFCPFLAQFSPEDYMQFAQAMIGKFFGGKAMEAHEQMRKKLWHNFVSIFPQKFKKLTFKSCKQLHCFVQKYIEIIEKNTQKNVPSALADCVLEERDFLEILAVESYIFRSKITMLYNGYVGDIRHLHARIHGLSDGLREMQYDLAYFDVRLCIAEYVKQGNNQHLRINFSPKFLLETVPALPAPNGRYKELLEERLANFELARLQQSSNGALAIATHDIQNVVETFRKSNKFSQRLTLRASSVMQAGEAHVELRTGMYWRSTPVALASVGVMLLFCSFFSVMGFWWGIPICFLLFLAWTFWKQQ